MSSVLWQVLGFGLFLILAWVGETALQRVSPRRGAERQARGLMLATGLGGLIGAWPWAMAVPHAFAWSLPAGAAHLLGLAGISFALIMALILWTGTVSALRFGCWLILIYLAPLAVAIFARHLDRFDFGAPVTWVFVAIVLILSLTAALSLLRLPFNQRGLPGREGTVIGLLALALGGVLFAWPEGPWTFLWPWPGDPLTTRLIASMALSVGVGGILAAGPAERRLALTLALVYGLGVVAVVALAFAIQGSGPVLYALVWAAIAALAIRGLLSGRAAGPGSAPIPPA